MSTDLRTTLDTADSVTNWQGQGKHALNTSVGQYYEPTGAIEDQRSNADEDTYQSVLAGGPYDLSDSTCYLLSKDNLVDSFGNGGVQYLIGDGTDRIGYDVGGYDAPGMALRYYYNAHKLDVSVIVATPGAFAVYAGSEANLTQTAITQAGIGTLHLAKAVGSIANCWVDFLSFHTNGSYALRINGGTVGTPETMVDVQGDDETNGWGLVNNSYGAQYGFFGPTEWGEPAANNDVYFTATDEQWFWIGDNAGGHTVGANNFPFRIVGNATDTIDIKWTNLVIVNTGQRAEFIAGDANVDIMQFNNVTFTDVGEITFPAVDIGNKYANGCSFNNCGQVDPSSTIMDGNTWNGSTDATGALLVAASVDNIDNASFISDGTGHGVYITATGSYNFDFWLFSGFGADGTTDAAVYNNSGGVVTLNILNSGDTPTIRNGAGASTIINNSVTITVQGVTEGAAVKVVANETAGTITVGDVILEDLADVNGEASVSINYEGAFEPSGLDVITRCRSSGLPSAAIADNNGVYVDETTAANQANAAVMNLLPTVPVATEDAYLIGNALEFGKIKIHVGTAGTGTYAIQWQYWNGAWTALSGVTDGTDSFKNQGLNYVEFTIPGDWVASTINTQGPFNYVRAYMASGTATIVPLGTRCSLDVPKYLPFVQDGVVSNTGLTVTASWNLDTIATF